MQPSIDAPNKLLVVGVAPAAESDSAVWRCMMVCCRYLLQLFRDFVFHQGEHDSGRLLDWGHTIECLNKVWH
jgi:hypothetical protein